jgi:hypothetical protein
MPYIMISAALQLVGASLDFLHHPSLYQAQQTPNEPLK